MRRVVGAGTQTGRGGVGKELSTFDNRDNADTPHSPESHITAENPDSPDHPGYGAEPSALPKLSPVSEAVTFGRAVTSVRGCRLCQKLSPLSGGGSRHWQGLSALAGGVLTYVEHIY